MSSLSISLAFMSHDKQKIYYSFRQLAAVLLIVKICRKKMS